MELSINTFFIVCPLVFLGGFVDAIAGGGGLISIPAYMIAGLPAHYSIATNKVSACMGTSMATYKLARAGNIPLKKALPCIFTAIFGAALGARLALMVPADIFLKLMLVVIPLTAIYVTRTNSMDRVKERDADDDADVLRAAVVAFVIGTYDGFYGPGTGTFLILLLSGFAHFTLGESNGVAKAINLTTSISSMVVYLISGKIILTLGLVAGIFGILGNYIGVNFFIDRGSKVVKPIMLIVLTIFFIRVITEIT